MTSDTRDRPADEASGEPRPLRITVENGNLKFVREPLMVGHYRSVRLTGTERVVDAIMGGAMKAALDVGAYPDAPGTSAVFVNTRASPDDPSRLPRPPGVVVVGLGDEANLRVADLTNTVRQGALAVVRRFAEQPAAPAAFGLAATLIASGGTGISAGQAALAIAQGVRDANARLAAIGRWPLVESLRIVEMFRERASDAWRALQVLSASTPGHYEIAEYVQAGTGAIARPSASSYRGADYDFVTVEMPQDGEVVAYTLDMRRARHEVRAQATQGRLVRDLVDAAADGGRGAGIGRALFQLLVPLELEPFLAATTDLQMSLDAGAAAIPWELLDPGQGDGQEVEPWSIRTRLIRNLRTSIFRESVADAAADASVLVVGEPKCTDPAYPPIPAARAEARAVAERLRALGEDRVKVLVAREDGDGPDALAVTTALLERPWRIVHVSGHGKQPDPKEPGGVVLSSGTLGAREIHCMRVVPELVFVNCCHLGSMSDPRLLGAPSRSRFAANVAEGLIREGVRCVVAAGWAVEDTAAQAFATTFYDALLAGRTFAEAVVAARKEARASPLGEDTWAAYQCYGDRDWRLRRGPQASRAAVPAPPPVLEIPSEHELKLAVDRLATELGDGGGPDDERSARIDELRRLEDRYGPRWGGVGSVAEAFGAAFGAAADPARAIAWYRRAVAANDGTATMKAPEQLGNLLAREAASRALAAQARGGGEDARKAAAEARAQVEEAIAFLERLVALQPTVERESLCGSAYKRKAIVEEAARSAPEADAAIRKMRDHYAAGLRLAREGSARDLFYPALNFAAADLVDGFAAPEPRPLDPALAAEIRGCLAARNDDFWTLSAAADLALYEALAVRRVAAAKDEVLRAYADLHERAPAPWSWRSVRDQARFVLARYVRRVEPGERDAADAVLAALERYAGANA